MNGFLGTLVLVAGLVYVTAHAQAPCVFWASDPVAPDETVLLIGDGLSADCVVEVGRRADDAQPPTDTPVALPEGAVRCEALQASGQSLKFVLPASLLPGAFVCRVTSPAGAATVVLNRPAAWWVQGDGGLTASPGGWVRVQGKCLAVKGITGRLLLTGPKTVELPVTGDAYSTRADLPPDLPPGEYGVRVHSGYGGAGGWSDALALRVEAPREWPATTLNVRDLGAAGDGLQDDTAAVKAGLEQLAAAGGGTLYFPRGRYLVSGTFHIPERTVLKGEARELVLIAWPDRDDPLPDMLVATHDFALEDLTFGLSNYGNFLTTDIHQETSGNVRLRRIRVLGDRYRGHMYQDPEEMSKRFERFGVHDGKLLSLGGRNVEITDCDFLSSSCCLFLTRARSALVRGNRFRMGRFGWYWLSGSDGVILEDNELQGADLSTWGGGINNLDGSPASQHVYVARNRLAFYYGGDHEAITTDGSGSTYFGHVTSMDGARLTLAEDANWEGRDWHGAGVFILGGKGMCQYRALVSYEGREIEVDRPWDVAPDETSFISISPQQRRLLFVGNEFEEVGVAIQLYGTSIECVAEGNRCRRGMGFINMGMNYYGNQPSWFTQWLNNEIAEGNSYGNAYFSNGASAIEVSAAPPSGDFPCPLNVGTVVRGNRLVSNSTIVLGAGNPPNLAARCPWLRDAVVERNTVRDADFGIVVADEAPGVLLRGNEFRNVLQPEVNVAGLRARALTRRQELAGSREPIAHWSFDALAGGKVRDLAANGLDAAATSGLEVVPQGVLGLAARFDGETYLTVGGAASFVQDILNQPQFTLAVWVRPDDIVGRRPLIGKRFQETNAPFILSIQDGAVCFEASDAGSRYSYNFSSAPCVIPGEWQHLAAVVQSGVGVTLWRNGQQVADHAVTAVLGENAEPLVFGRDPWAGPGVERGGPALYVGLMDEAKFWARPLAAEELAAEYAAATRER